MVRFFMIKSTISRVTTPNRLTGAHKVRKQDILKQYGIPPSKVIKGVQCPECFRFPMQRQHGSWQCPLCSHRSKTAHLQALRDYFLLFSSVISNREARVFLHASSPHTEKGFCNRTVLLDSVPRTEERNIY